jgi:predicted NUDIX family phosphoesterase
MKSELQIRAERAAVLLRKDARKPIVIEFAGVPKAGKTSTLNQLQAFLKRCGFRVEVVIERASICPIRDKKHANFNIWTACTTLAQVLEKTQNPPRADDPQVLILDRGLFDSICWLTMMERLSHLRTVDREIVENFLCIDDWRKRVTGVIVMTASPRDAMDREKGYLPIEGATGSIMNVEVLEQMLNNTRECVERFKNHFRIYTVNTSLKETRDNPRRTSEIVVDIVLGLIEEQIQEDILCLPKSAVIDSFEGKAFLPPADAFVLLDKFVGSGMFHPREEVETDDSFVQALPVVVVRNKDGDILQLRRREKSESNPLHQKLVIWAGGHVRMEDATNGNSILQCALRELQEELRLSVEADELKLLGAIYADSGTRISKHLALVYEWRAETNDVAMVLSSVEFFERGGTSLSGSFITLENLVADIESKKITEIWSVEIVRNILAQTSFKNSPRLF